MKLPQARTKDIIEQDHNKETLIYDLTINKAFNLNETSTIVYKACGENATFDDLKQKHKFTDDFILLALDELKRNNLLAEDYISPFESTSRRELIKKVGLTTMFALPIITGLVAPKAINAASGQAGNQSGIGAGCQNQSHCQVGGCIQTAGGQDACCYGGSGIIVLPGNTYSVGEGAPVYDVIFPDAPRENLTACQDLIKCCDRSTPIGGCTYTPVSDMEFEGKILVLLTCNCACR